MKISKVTFICNKKFKLKDVRALRGYFGSKNIEENYFHNHNKDGTSIYRTPMIYYGLEDGNFTITAYNDLDVSIMKEFFQCDEFIIRGETIKVFEKKIETKEDVLDVRDKMYRYRFKTMWIALNQENYQKYLRNEIDLNKLLRNQLLMNFSGLGIQVNKEIMVVGDFKRDFTEIKSQKMIGFYGSFYTNVEMPSGMRIGKYRSLGYGEVEKID